MLAMADAQYSTASLRLSRLGGEVGGVARERGFTVRVPGSTRPSERLSRSRFTLTEQAQREALGLPGDHVSPAVAREPPPRGVTATPRPHPSWPGATQRLPPTHRASGFRHARGPVHQVAVVIEAIGSLAVAPAPASANRGTWCSCALDVPRPPFAGNTMIRDTATWMVGQNPSSAACGNGEVAIVVLAAIKPATLTLAELQPRSAWHFEAAIPEIRRHLFATGHGGSMRIVAGDAPESAPAGAEALALVHLLEQTGHDDTILGRCPFPLQHRPEAIERQPWPKVFVLAASPQDAPLAIQVALLARRRPE